MTVSTVNRSRQRVFHCSFCDENVYGETKLYETEDEVAVETFCEKCGHILKEHRMRKFHRSPPHASSYIEFSVEASK